MACSSGDGRGPKQLWQWQPYNKRARDLPSSMFVVPSSKAHGKGVRGSQWPQKSSTMAAPQLNLCPSYVRACQAKSGVPGPGSYEPYIPSRHQLNEQNRMSAFGRLPSQSLCRRTMREKMPDTNWTMKTDEKVWAGQGFAWSSSPTAR